jgi:hypothetical protein
MPLEHPRVTLPKNLAETLKRLEDAELVTLFREVTVEVERRGMTVPAAKVQGRQSKSSGAPADLPAGKANLIKASYSAGMKPVSNCPHVQILAIRHKPGLEPACEIKESGARYDRCLPQGN